MGSLILKWLKHLNPIENKDQMTQYYIENKSETSDQFLFNFFLSASSFKRVNMVAGKWGYHVAMSGKQLNQ